MSEYKVSIDSDGQKRTWPLVFENLGPSQVTCTNTVATFTVPAGISIVGPKKTGTSIIDVEQGFFNRTTNEYAIGNLTYGDSIPLDLEFQVDNISLAPVDGIFVVNVDLSSSCVETSELNNYATFLLEVVDPCTQVTLVMEGYTEEDGFVDIEIS